MELKSIVKEDFLVFEHDAPMSEVIGKLQQFEKKAGIVFRNKKYLGLVEKRRLVSARVDPEKTKIAGYIQKAPLIAEDSSVLEAASLLVGSDVGHLPVEKDKQIIGVVGMIDLTKLAIDDPELNNLKISDVKFLKSAKVKKDDPLTAAIEVMHTKHVDHIPVFDKGKLFGVLSYKDIIRKHFNWNSRRDKSAKFNSELHSRAAQADFPPLDLPVEDFSTNDNLVSLKTKDSLKEAVGAMLDSKVNSVVVMEGNDFQGLLSARNLLQAVGKMKKVKNYTINIKGLNDVNLTEHQSNLLNSIIEKEASRMQRSLSENFKVEVHLKETNKAGKQSEYEVHLRVNAPGNMFATKKSDWDVETALHKCFNVVRSQLER